MRKIFFLVLVLLTLKSNAQTYNLGCVDCFNFVAPTVEGAENVSPAEVGLIVYDVNQDAFRGYSRYSGWTSLGQNKTFAVSTKTSSYLVLSSDDIILADATSGAVTMTLPTAVNNAGKLIKIKKSDSTGNQVTIDTVSSQTIDGSSQVSTTTQNELFTFVSDGSNWLVTENYVPGVQDQIAPTGTVNWYSGTSAPSGWLIGDGSTVSRTTYAALYAVVGDSFGSGDGSTTFHLPDCRGRFIRGFDNGAGNDPDALSRTASNTGGNTGDSIGSLQADELKSHNHGVTDPGHSHNFVKDRSGISGTDMGNGFQSGNIDDSTSSSTTGITINNHGGNETRPKNISLNCIIKF